MQRETQTVSDELCQWQHSYKIIIVGGLKMNIIDSLYHQI